MNKLKSLRVIFALFFIILITFFFVDFPGFLPLQVHGLLHFQLVPAILAGSIAAVIFLLLLTVLFGRVYCSFLCPAGIFQDIFIRFSKRGQLKKNKRRRWFSYHKPSNILRYTILGLTVILFLFGSTHSLLYLDPYSNYGRIATNLFSPIVIFGNDLLAENPIGVYNITVAALIASIAIFLLFGILSVVRGRLFCNTLCPVGGLLSLFSRYSFFRISFDKEACNNCGLCERCCKSECINSREQTVDASRCINCFNCLSSCQKRNAVHYRFAPVFRKPAIENSETKTTSESRRSFLALSGTILATIPVLQSCGKQNNDTKPLPVLPPGAGNLKRFSEKCTACHLCVARCPTQIIQPAGLQFGFNHLLKPQLNFEQGYCDYDCTMCTLVCPTGALKPMPEDEKKTTQLGIAHFELERCVVYTSRKRCGDCYEQCPTQAIKMVAYKGSRTIPQVTPDICIGCGACEYICPASPVRAIYVIANETLQLANMPE